MAACSNAAGTGPNTITDTVEGPYDDNAYGTTEGQLLFSQMNCSGCHANGGGAIGPPLIKDVFIYGNDPENIFDTIVKGRPNGMPSWAHKIPDEQIWEIAAYVRSLSTSTTANGPDQLTPNPPSPPAALPQPPTPETSGIDAKK